MAVAKGQVFTESTPGNGTKYIGMAAVKVLAVNPTKEELEKIYGNSVNKAPEYLSETEITLSDGSKRKYPSARITFICQIVPEKNNGIDAIIQHTFFLQKRYRAGEKSGKWEVIDPYGRTAWGTRDEVDGKQIPMYKDGPANIDKDFRPAYVGEEYLTLFLKNLLNIPNIQKYVDDKWVDNTDVKKEECLMRLDEIDNYFTGNFKELQKIITFQPENLVKIGLGVRHTDDGKIQQTTFDGISFKNAVTDYTKLMTEVEGRKRNGGFADREFSTEPVHEYVIEATSAAELANNDYAAGGMNPDDDPFAQ